MSTAANVLVALIGLQHVGFLVLEMFLWTTPTGMGVFGLTPEFAEQSAGLAANQGLYNGFLAAGLFWSLGGRPEAHGLKVFFLGCVVVAGVFGAATVSQTILLVQGAPAALALTIVLLSKRSGR